MATPDCPDLLRTQGSSVPPVQRCPDVMEDVQAANSTQQASCSAAAQESQYNRPPHPPHLRDHGSGSGLPAEQRDVQPLGGHEDQASDVGSNEEQRRSLSWTSDSGSSSFYSDSGSFTWSMDSDSTSLSSDSGWWVKERGSAWFWKFLMSRHADEEVRRWENYMRMTPSRFFGLVETMRPHITLNTTDWRSTYPPELRLGVCIYKLATGADDDCIAMNTGIDESSVSDIIQQIVPKFIQVFGYKIGFPDSPTGLDSVVKGFAACSSLPGVVGAIGATEITINMPKAHPQSYHCKLISGYCITLLAVCDSETRFLSISAGCPGSYQNSKALRLSGLHKQAQEGGLAWLQHTSKILPPSPVQIPAGRAGAIRGSGVGRASDLPYAGRSRGHGRGRGARQPHVIPQADANEVTAYLVGDKSYPCLPWLISPFKVFKRRDIPAEESHFNDEHTKAWLHVERSFQLLKGMWASLSRGLEFSHHFAASWVHFACILHNMWLDNKDISFEKEEQDVDDLVDMIAKEENGACLPEVRSFVREGTGVVKRAQLMHHVWQVRGGT